MFHLINSDFNVTIVVDGSTPGILETRRDVPTTRWPWAPAAEVAGSEARTVPEAMSTSSNVAPSRTSSAHSGANITLSTGSR